MRLLEYIVFHPWRAATVLLVGIGVGLGAFYVYEVSAALGAVAVEDFNPEGARTAIEGGNPDPAASGSDLSDASSYDLHAELALIAAQLGEGGDRGDFNTAAMGSPIPDDVFEAYLLVGTDASGLLADTIILGLQPTDGDAPIMVSLPRDLFVWNLCEKTFTRLNSGLGGCSGVATGSELLAIMVEDYTGVPIDHLARVDFSGFARIVDVMGGVNVCVDHPTRDIKAHLQIESAGCGLVDGETALAWVRSRHPEQLIDGVWTAVTGSDFTRQDHQQDVLFQLAGKAAGFSSPSALAERLSAVSLSVRLDSSWSFGQLVGAAWQHRGLTEEDVARFQISVTDYRTSYGAQVLLPSTPFRAQLSEVYDFD